MDIRIAHSYSDFEREPLAEPFGFKGAAMSEIWQTIALLESESAIKAIGLCSQNVLWADPRVFAGFSEAGANARMYAVTDFALQHVCGMSFNTPLDLMDSIIDDVEDYARKITGDVDLHRRFVLNALVGLELAAWLLYAAENCIASFDQMIPADYRPALRKRHAKVAAVPLISYGTPAAEIAELAAEGCCLVKVKLGQRGSQEQMLQKDKERLGQVHAVFGACETPYTENGRVLYYLDANGRYENKETIVELLDFADRIGALERIALLEEPFAEELSIDAADLPVRVAADESVCSETELCSRIELGYRALALKPIAKTLSLSLKLLKAAYVHNIPCFCADLTAHPILVDWNKNIAARLEAFPGLKNMGFLETNGAQLYRNWQRLMSRHPAVGAAWLQSGSGIFFLDDDFYRCSGGIFSVPHYYEKLVSVGRQNEDVLR